MNGDFVFIEICIAIITLVVCVGSSRLYKLLNNVRLIEGYLKEMVARQAQANQQRAEIARAMQWIVDRMNEGQPPRTDG